MSNDRPKATGDWRDQRYAMLQALKELGLSEDQINKDNLWDFVASVLKHHKVLHARFCMECNCEIHGYDVRCLDCKGVFCEHCAAIHFWPNGRPKDK